MLVLDGRNLLFLTYIRCIKHTPEITMAERQCRSLMLQALGWSGLEWGCELTLTLPVYKAAATTPNLASFDPSQLQIVCASGLSLLAQPNISRCILYPRRALQVYKFSLQIRLFDVPFAHSSESAAVPALALIWAVTISTVADYPGGYPEPRCSAIARPPRVTFQNFGPTIPRLLIYFDSLIDSGVILQTASP